MEAKVMKTFCLISMFRLKACVDDAAATTEIDDQRIILINIFKYF